MEEKDQTRNEFLKVSKFQSIKTRILVFALLATIVPSLVLGGLSYYQNSKLLREKISKELHSATVQTSNELDLWLKERFYDLRVFSSSYIISENLVQILQKPRSSIGTVVALDHIKRYLDSVSEKFTLYEELTLMNLSAEALVTSAADLSKVVIPSSWIEQRQSVSAISAKTQFNPKVFNESMLIAEEVLGSDGRPLGVLVAKISLSAISSILKLRSMEGIDEIYLMEASGRILVSSEPMHQVGFPSISSIDIPSAMRSQNQKPRDYIGYRDKAVIGMALPIESMGWLIVAEIDKKNAYADIILLRKITITIVAGLMLFIGLIGYVFGQSLVWPVQRLSREAASVASGNLDVDIPVTGLSEVSYLTQVFNHMVDSLRHSREEISTAHNSLLETNKVLQQLSITDGLTGLFNRKHIMDLFGREVVRSQRYDKPLTILLLDIDHFKEINDTCGHQTGDAVLGQLAESLMQSVRECDYVGRYGGEEFLIILPDSNIQSGFATAERIRKNVSTRKITVNKDNISLTVSIGVAGYPKDGGDVESIIRKADDALYKAKANGRNRVTVLENHGAAETAAEHNRQNPILRVIGST